MLPFYETPISNLKKIVKAYPEFIHEKVVSNKFGSYSFSPLFLSKFAFSSPVVSSATLKTPFCRTCKETRHPTSIRTLWERWVHLCWLRHRTVSVGRPFKVRDDLYHFIIALVSVYIHILWNAHLWIIKKMRKK